MEVMLCVVATVSYGLPLSFLLLLLVGGGGVDPRKLRYWLLPSCLNNYSLPLSFLLQRY